MKRPSADDMNLASEWLDAYDSDAEGECMYRVAAWLREQAQQSMERDAAKVNRVPVKALRNKLKGVSK